MLSRYDDTDRAFLFFSGSLVCLLFGMPFTSLLCSALWLRYMTRAIWS